MPPRTTSSPIRVRRVLAAAGLLLFATAFVSARYAGRWLVREDPLTHADAIFVLGGSPGDRVVEAGDLQRAGWAPIVVLSREILDGGEMELARRGLRVPAVTDGKKDILVQMGVPPNAIVVLPPVHDSTSDEGRSLAALSRERDWSRIIVVTSKLHTRRAGRIMRRALAGTGVQIVVRTATFDRADPDRWWKSRSDARFVLLELQKLLAYFVGFD